MVNDLVEHVEISVANLELGKSIKVSDIKIPNVEILNLPYFPVASVYIPRVIEETPAAAAVPAEGVAAPAEGAAPAAGAAPAKPGAEGEKKAEGKPEVKAEKKPEGKEKK